MMILFISRHTQPPFSMITSPHNPIFPTLPHHVCIFRHALLLLLLLSFHSFPHQSRFTSVLANNGPFSPNAKPFLLPQRHNPVNAMARSKHHKRTRSASSTSSTNSDPLHRPLLREVESEDDIEALQSIYPGSSDDSDASSIITGFERLGSDLNTFFILPRHFQFPKAKSASESLSGWRNRRESSTKNGE